MAGNVVSNLKKYYGGQVPVPGQGDSDGKVKMLVEKTATIEIGGVQTEVELLFDSDDLTTPVTPQQLGQWTDENYLIVFKTRSDEGVVRGFVLYALSTESTSTDTLVNRAEFISFKGDMTHEPGASAYEFTMVEDSSTLVRYLRDENGELIVKFDKASVEPGAQSDTLDNLISSDSEYMSFEVVHEGDNAYLNLNTESLGDEIEGIWENINYIIDALDELPSDEHGYFNSSLYTTPGDGTTTNLVMGDFRIMQDRDVHGENIEFVPTHQEGGIDFGEVYLNPGTYIFTVHYTLQWVGNPRGTFLPLVTNVGDRPFDFSYEHEDVVRTTRIVTRTTRGKFSLGFPIDADTPSMGIWVKNLEIAQIASYNHPAVAHDTTLTGTGKLGDPLGVTPAAFGKIKDIPTSISQFRTGDVIPVDGPSGTAKLAMNDLLQKKVDKKSLNLFTNENATSDHCLLSNGSVAFLTGRNYTDFIEVEASTEYSATRSSGLALDNNSNICHCFYTDDKTFISSVPSTTTSFTTPVTCKYVRLSYEEVYLNIQLQQGSARSTYYPYNPVQGYLQDYETLNAADEKVLKDTSPNMYDQNSVIDGFFLLPSGSYYASDSYCISDYIPVEVNTQYSVTKHDGGAVGAGSSVYHVFYNSSKEVVGSSVATSATLTTNASTSYVRISVYKSFTEIQMEKGSSRTDYKEYSPIGGYIQNLVDRKELGGLVLKKAGLNLFTEDGSVIDKFLTSSGSEAYVSGCNCSDFIEVESSTLYYVNGVRSGGIFALSSNSNICHCFYTDDKTFISSVPSTTTSFTTPVTCKYVRLSYVNNVYYIQLVKNVNYLGRISYSPVGGYVDKYGVSVEHLNRHRALPSIKTLGAVCIIADDGTASSLVYADMLLDKGLSCGFALPLDGNLNYQAERYYKYIRQGFSVQNHNGNALTTYADEAAAKIDVYKGYFELNRMGLGVSGFVCPGNAYVDAYRTMLGKVHAFCFGISSSSLNTHDSDILKLSRFSIEEDTTSLNDVKNLIDSATTDGKMLCLYLHSWRIGASGYHDMDFHKELADYILSKRNNGDLYFGNPDECVRYYFG